MDLPVKIRAHILNFALDSPKDYWLDRRVINIQNSLLSRFGKHFWEFLGAPGAANLLCLNKQIRREVQEILFISFAFFSDSWHLISDWLRFPSQLEFFPMREIRHIVFTTQVPRQFKHEQVRLAKLLSLLPKLESVRIMVTSSTTLAASNKWITEECTDYILKVALLFRGVKQVSVIGQDLVHRPEMLIVRDARRRLREMNQPWYLDLHLNYLPCRNGVLLTHEEHRALAYRFYPPISLLTIHDMDAKGISNVKKRLEDLGKEEEEKKKKRKKKGKKE